MLVARCEVFFTASCTFPSDPPGVLVSGGSDIVLLEDIVGYRTAGNALSLEKVKPITSNPAGPFRNLFRNPAFFSGLPQKHSSDFVLTMANQICSGHVQI